MQLDLDIQNTVGCEHLPSEQQIKDWILTVLQHSKYSASSPSITLRIVSLQESECLNSDFRGKNKPTNVLSFPFEAPEAVNIPEMQEYVGDLAICAKLVEQEADKQLKLVESHWAHLIVHGVLHLLGFDHLEEAQAAEMETLEIAILASLGFCDPYIVR